MLQCVSRLASRTALLICKSALSKVTLKFAVADSETIKSRVDANTLDPAVVFEDDLVARFSCVPSLFDVGGRTGK
jgi:hypothetical protein